jgi:hypothetical protein
MIVLLPDLSRFFDLSRQGAAAPGTLAAASGSG